MPWTKKQQQVAQAVKHGWHPKGSAKGFTKAFASEVVAESKTMPTRPPVSKDEDERRKRAESKLGKGAHASRK